MRKVCLMILLAVVSSSAGNLYAITDEEISRIIPFSFVNPGARSTAMGGAFIGLADDATAAEANPAGLIILTKPEVSVEYRNTQFAESELGDIEALITPDLSVVSFQQSLLDDLNQVSFASVVYPFGDVVTLAFSRQEVLTQKGSLDELIVINLNPAIAQINVTADGEVDLSVVNWNFSGAVKLGQKFSLGATARYSQLDWNASTNNILELIAGDFVAVTTSETSIDQTDGAFAFVIGGLWRPDPHFSLGGVYKQNPKFSVTETQIGDIERSFENVLKLPDVYGFGVAVKPNDNITVTSDVVRIEYSQLTDDMVVGVNVLTQGLTDADIQYEVKNGTEFHVGGEVVAFMKNIPVALRIGYYRKPIPSLIVESAPGLDELSRQIAELIYTERDPENHFTFGNGYVFGPHFQVDWALDLSNNVDSFVLSSVVRF